MSGAADWDDFFERPEDDPDEVAFQDSVAWWVERLQKAPARAGPEAARD